MRIPFLLLYVLVMLTSCNVVRMGERQADRALRRAGAVEHTYSTPGGPRHTRNVITGKPVLMLVHGINGSGRMWARNAGCLSTRFDLILPDLIGHGRSTRAWTGNSVDEQVEHLRIILDSSGVKAPVHLVGCSYGGGVVANFAERYPERVKTLVIYDGPASDYSSAMADSIAQRAGATDIIDLFAPENADEQDRLFRLALFDPPWMPRFALRQINERSKREREPCLALLRDLRANGEHYVSKRYAWPMPTFLIWGEADRLIPLSVARAIQARHGLPADHLIVIPKAGHAANYEQQEAFESALLRILVD